MTARSQVETRLMASLGHWSVTTKGLRISRRRAADVKYTELFLYESIKQVSTIKHNLLFTSAYFIKIHLNSLT